MDEQIWLNKSVEILTDIQAWRQVPPKATYVEIEEEVHRRMMEQEVQILQDAAHASASREWGITSEQPAPPVPDLRRSSASTRQAHADVARQWRAGGDAQENLRIVSSL